MSKNYKILAFNSFASALCTVLRVVADYAVAVAVVFLALMARDALITVRRPMAILPSYRFLVLPLSYMIFAHMYGLYTRRKQFTDEILCVLKAVILGAFVVTVILYLTKTAASTSRLFVILWALFLFPCLAIERLGLKNLVKANKFLATPAIILLGGDADMKVLEELHEGIGVGYNFIGYMSFNEVEQSKKSFLPHLGTWEDAPSVLRETGIQHVFIISHKLPLTGIETLIARLQPIVKHITIVPTLGKLPLSSLDLVSVMDGRYVMFCLHNNLNFWQNRMFKFIFDYTMTVIGTVLISPVLLLIAIAIKLDSRGPVFFAHKRLGLGGKTFNCYKFRSMKQDAEEVLKELLANDPEKQKEWDKDFKLKNDPRVTRLGKFLRATSLDELPQIFNVLKGEMSLVGPRPIVEKEIERYGDSYEDYKALRPGLTGLWQTSGRNDISYPERVRLDTWYAKNWTLWLDIVILWRTVKTVLGGKGAY